MVETLSLNKFLGRRDPSELSDEVKKYNERRFKQMALFYGCTVATFLCSKISHRGVISRRYVPNYYQHNHVPPPFSFYRDALTAVTLSTLLAISTTSMFVTGSFWYLDISNFKEFSFRLKKYLGGEEKETELMKLPLDKDSESIQNSINDFINDYAKNGK
ncbi:hypothetical protein PACTADRAFT_50191 [Pachysolen tannophilus NRRL Y-2460]|uniref:Altered inheritance of mitochondria protein 11 n=1 Tax=Pachysolen tannophilus NRRL Y-2460 TaxID=669874 RepID=A0A1E4TUM2_PACTA|nr:hypothetical protein PACTADRAFT_50191 [Pachysolen tannophilus NRRL Y-2460]